MKNRRLRVIAAFVCLYSFLSSCARQESNPKAVVVKAGELLDDRVIFLFAVYPKAVDGEGRVVVKGRPAMDRDQIIEFARTNYPALNVGLKKSGTGNSTVAIFSKITKEDSPIPDAAFLEHFGKGLTPDDMQGLGDISLGIGFAFDLENSADFANLKTAVAFMDDLARLLDGYVWDDEARMLYTGKAFTEEVVSSWTADPVMVWRNTALHQYEEEGSLRSITVGMQKFGLPDIVVEGSARNKGDSVKDVILIACQYLAENPGIEIKGRLFLDLRSLKDSGFRKDYVDGLLPNGRGKGMLLLERSPLVQGDAENRLWRLGFAEAEGKAATVDQAAFLAGFFGFEDKAVSVTHDDELLAASETAKKQLPQIRERFNKGLESGEALFVKAPFPIPTGGNEWMWVEVKKWENETIEGILDNVPEYARQLKPGQQVTVQQKDVFDYLIRHEDGTIEGNTTSALIEGKSRPLGESGSAGSR